MEVWMIICLALLLIGIGVLIYNNASTQRRKRLENEAFLAEADDMMGFHLTLTGREDYAQKLQATFNEFKAVKKWRDEDLEQDPLLTDPVDAWQRNLPADKINSLKAHLIKRMVNVLGQAAPFQQELQTRFVMLQRGLISEQQWKQFAEAKNALDQEILLIKFEAECLQDKFGNEGIVFKEANKFYLHELQKKKMELNKARLANISPEMIQELAKRSGGRIVLQGPNGGPVPAAVKAPSESPMPRGPGDAGTNTPSTGVDETAEKLRMRKMAAEGAKEECSDSSSKDKQCFLTQPGPSENKKRRGGKRRK